MSFLLDNVVCGTYYTSHCVFLLDWLQARNHDAFASHPIGSDLNPKFAAVRRSRGDGAHDNTDAFTIVRSFIL